MKNKIYLISFLVIVGLIAVSHKGILNGWSLLTGRGFIIPEESSIFHFDVTVMNEGSGEWWVYGEDPKFYYHFSGDSVELYIKISKQQASTCSSFNPTDHLTWCNRR